MKLNFAVVGSRTFNDYEKLEFGMLNIIEYFKKNNEDFSINNIVIISGGAAGADFLAEKFADKFNIEKKIFLPKFEDYKKIGNKIFYDRNIELVKNSHIGIAFWDYKSPGTKMTINQFKKENKPIHIVKI